MIKEIEEVYENDKQLKEELNKMVENDPSVTLYFKKEEQLLKFMIMCNKRMQDFFQIPFYFNNVEDEQVLINKILKEK